MAKGMQNMMKQAQKLQQQMMAMQGEMAKKTVEGSAGGGMVTAVIPIGIGKQADAIIVFGKLLERFTEMFFVERLPIRHGAGRQIIIDPIGIPAIIKNTSSESIRLADVNFSRRVDPEADRVSHEWFTRNQLRFQTIGQLQPL